MVTHDPVGASYADRIVFLADGLIVDEMREPTAEKRPRPDEVAGGLDVREVPERLRCGAPR